MSQHEQMINSTVVQCKTLQTYFVNSLDQMGDITCYEEMMHLFRKLTPGDSALVVYETLCQWNEDPDRDDYHFEFD